MSDPEELASKIKWRDLEVDVGEALGDESVREMFNPWMRRELEGLRIRRVDLEVDVGEALGDESLREVFGRVDHSAISEKDESSMSESERSRVCYLVHFDDTDHQTPFISLSPPPRHLSIFFDKGSSSDALHLPSLKHFLRTSVCTLHVAPVDMHFMEFICKFLGDQPPESPLRTLGLSLENIPNEAQQLLLHALSQPQCKVKHLKLTCCDPPNSSNLDVFLSSCKLSTRLESVWLDPFPLVTSAESLKRITAHCKELHVVGSNIQTDDASQFLLKFMAKALGDLQSCNLRRLDLTSCPFLIPPPSLEVLLQAVTSPSSAIQDLGLNLLNYRYDEVRYEYIHGREEDTSALYSCFAQVLTSGIAHCKIRALRLKMHDTCEAVTSVTKVLATPGCKVVFLHVSFFFESPSTIIYFPYFVSDLQALLKTGGSHFQCLRIEFHNAKQHYVSILASLARFLRQEYCPLHWLNLFLGEISEHDTFLESMEMDMANALEQNYIITCFSYRWKSLAARSRAAAFLARNNLYKSSGLSQEERVKSHVTRLFICGHSGVGKTTIRKALIQLNAQQGVCGFNKMLKMTCKQPVHQLGFRQGHELKIFDLGGQFECQAFYHLLFSNTTSNDVFMLVCKHSASTTSSQVRSQFEYWLRFIVSHRKSASPPHPKVIMVVNFFQKTANQAPRTAESIDMYYTKELTEGPIGKFAEDLDFGSAQMDQVFGLCAMDTGQVMQVLNRLQELSKTLLEHRATIPKLCHEISSIILPSLIQRPQGNLINGQQNRIFNRIRKLYSTPTSKKTSGDVSVVPVAQIRDYILKEQQVVTSEENRDSIALLEGRIHAALQELHNTGELLFFPPSEYVATKESSQQDPAAAAGTRSSEQLVVVTNPGWFCNMVVGNLLAPIEFDGIARTNELDVRRIIRRNAGCPREFVGGIFRYMQELQLCFSLEGEDGDVFFPTVAREKMLAKHFPRVFEETGCSSGSKNKHIFIGRRLKCKHTEKHLIPFGVFARLQVELQKFCGNQSYRMGYKWASFIKDGIGVVVRFGGEPRTVYTGASTSNMPLKQPIDDDDDDEHPEWIDILLAWSKESSSSDQEQNQLSVEPTQREASQLAITYTGIQKLIYEMCQATSRGIPTVSLEEWDLRDKDHGDVEPLANILRKLQTKGIDGKVAWESQLQTDSDVELLLPRESQQHVKTQIEAIREIEIEFNEIGAGEISLGSDGSCSTAPCSSDQLPPEFQLLYERLSHKMDGLFKENINTMHRMQENILANCSTHLLTQLHVQGMLPVFPYLTDSHGKLQKLKNFVAKRARLHFLCEAPLHCPHKVEGQKGKEVAIEAGPLAKAAPYFVPALRVICCAARVAANVSLQGSVPDIFHPFIQMLDSSGITSQALQSRNVSKAVETLLEDIDTKLEHFAHKSNELMNEEERNRNMVALQQLLQNTEDLDMHRDFGLCLVEIRNQQGVLKGHWVCEEHALSCNRLRPVANPFLDRK